MREFEVMLDDNRFLDCLEAGDPDGSPLLFHNGTPGSRLLQPGLGPGRGRHRLAPRQLQPRRLRHVDRRSPGASIADVAGDSRRR